MEQAKTGEAAAIMLGGGFPKRERKPRPKCSSPGCDNPAENEWGTCDICQDEAYNGDGFGSDER